MPSVKPKAKPQPKVLAPARKEEHVKDTEQKPEQNKVEAVADKDKDSKEKTEKADVNLKPRRSTAAFNIQDIVDEYDPAKPNNYELYLEVCRLLKISALNIH